MTTPGLGGTGLRPPRWPAASTTSRASTAPRRRSENACAGAVAPGKTPRTEKTEPLILMRAGHRRGIAAVIACWRCRAPWWQGPRSGRAPRGVAVGAPRLGAQHAQRPRASERGPGRARRGRGHDGAWRCRAQAARPRRAGRVRHRGVHVGLPAVPALPRPGEFAQEFGPRPSTISSVRDWLEGRGLVVGPTSGNGLIVPISGTATQVGQAFDLGLEQYRLPSGRMVRVPDAEPLVPAPWRVTCTGDGSRRSEPTGTPVGPVRGPS